MTRRAAPGLEFCTIVKSLAAAGSGMPEVRRADVHI